MPSLQTHNNSGRKKLVVTKAPEAKQITGKDDKPLNFIEFMAKVEGEDATVKYSVWSKTLSDYFKLDAVVDCDVVVTDQKNVDPDGNPYKNRKITQVYQDGKPVKEQQQGKTWGKSPETVAMEIDSKFRNTALMQACEMAKSEGKTIPVNHVLEIADKFYHWLKPDASNKATAVSDKQIEELFGDSTTTDMKALLAKWKLPDTITTASDLISYAVRKGLPLAKTYEALGVTTPTEVKDLVAAIEKLAPLIPHAK